LPRRCVSCGAPADLVCGDCRGRLRILGEPRCALCGAPTAWPVSRCRECAGRRLGFASARAAVAYSSPAPELVRAWKEQGLRRGAILAAELVAAHVERPPADVITYIPPDPERQLRRMGHPAERLAEELGPRWGLEVRRLLARTRNVPRQASLPVEERRRNVRGAFGAADDVPPVRVVLVDDVYTTGSTASAAAAALLSTGASVVHVVTFARTLR
jgi:predicted amidophosphoribosyltransferase